MPKVCPLFSGSEGNSVCIENNDILILVDIGRSSKQIEKSLYDNGFRPSNVRYIFITHEHMDHIKGLRTFAHKYRPKVFASHGTINQLLEKKILDEKIDYQIIDLSGISLDEINITPFEISHDCTQGFGYSISFIYSNLKISICSDLGIVSNDILDSLAGSNLVIIESNHDIDMLKSGSYPFFLKKRILSEKGHLSNLACCDLLSKLALKGTKKFILYHLSSVNNTPKLAYDLAFESLMKTEVSEFELYVAPKVNTGLININI